MLLCYSVEEAAEYIENLKLAETRNPMTTINNRAQYKQKQQMAHVGKKLNANIEQQKQVDEESRVCTYSCGVAKGGISQNKNDI